MHPIFSSDWFNRDNKTFTTRNTSMAIGWDVERSEHYSEFFYTPQEVRMLLNNDEKLVAELHSLIAAVGINARVMLTKEENKASTTGKAIKICTEFSKTITDDYDKMDVIIGLLLHEACHCKWTNFSYMREHCREYPEIVHYIHNIIEDELIERQMGLIRPGYINFLNKVKYYFFNEFVNDPNEDLNNDFDEIMRIFLAVIRYPDLLPRISEDVLDKHVDLFVDIKKILKKHGAFNDKTKSCTIKSVKAAIDIYYLIKNYIDEHNTNDESENDSNFDEGEIGEGDGVVLTNEPGEGNNDDKEIIGILILDSVVLSKIKDLYDHVSSSSEVIEIECKYDDDLLDVSTKEDGSYYLGRPCSTMSMQTSFGRSKELYDSYFNQVRPFINDFAKIVIPNKRNVVINTLRFQRNGTLDPTRLADAMQNTQTVYKRIITDEKKSEPKYALVLMIDESGSMDGYSCSRDASKLAILIYEAMSKYNDIELFVYGHGDVVNKYIDKDYTDKYVLGCRRSQGGQNEILAYNTIIDDVRSQTNLPIIAINITDSLYLANSEEMKNLVRKYRDEGVFINLFTLNHETMSEQVIAMNNLIYGEGNWVFWNNHNTDASMKEIAMSMARIIKHNVKL